MDVTWVTDRIGVGGGIWHDQNMEELVAMGVTHIIDMQVEFDDRPLAEPYQVKVLYNPTDDDFQIKPPELFQRGVDFALEALDAPATKVYVHCAAGVHRAPMMTLAILRVLGWPLEDARELIEGRRCRVTGTVTMDFIMVRSKQAPAVDAVATLVGEDGDETITLDDLAAKAGTISYEILTGLGKRVERVYR